MKHHHIFTNHMPNRNLLGVSDTVLLEMADDPECMLYASTSQRTNEDLVLNVVRKNGLALQHVSEELQKK